MYKILIIDDKEVFRRKIKRLPYWQNCQDHFVIACEAQNGREAMAILEKHPVDVVLTDIRMPLMDGIDLLKQINTLGYCRCVILLSEFASFSYAKAGIVNGAFDYILKPVDDDKIRECFERAYHYLTTIEEPTPSHERTGEVLANYLLAGELEKSQAYAQYRLTQSPASGTGLLAETIQSQEILGQLKGELLKRQPYLEGYIDFSALLDIPPVHTENERMGALNTCLHGLCQELAELAIPSSNAMVRAVCTRLLQEEAPRITLKTIAKSLHINTKYLGGLFKKEMGLSYSQYATFLSIKRAKKLLRSKDLKIYEIAVELGYRDIDYFSRVFKKETGHSPSTYREEGNHEG